MVSSIYTPNKRIGYYRDLSRALMPKQISAYNPNIRNPYAQTAGTNLANVLSGLVQTYSAQQQLGEAERLETAQKGAQRTIGGKLAALGIPSDQPILSTNQIETQGLYGDISPQMSLREMAFDRPQFTAEQMETAGTTPLLMQERVAGIRAGREKTYTARRKGEIENRLSAVSQAQVLDPENRALFDESQQLRALLDPAEFAKEASAEQTRKRQEARAIVTKKEAEGRALERTLDAEQRALGRKVNADEKAAIEWGRRYGMRRTDQTAAQIAAEERGLATVIAKEERRLGTKIEEEDRSWLRLVQRKELELGETLDAEARADLRTKNREYRGILRTLDGEKRAVATAIAAEERRLGTTITTEGRAKIARDLRAQFDDDRADVRAIAAAKRKRVDVYDVGTGDKFSITQEQMDSDQEGQAPTYKYGKPDKGKVGFIHFVPRTSFSAGGRNYLPGQQYQVTQRNITGNADLRNAIETQSDVVKPRQLEKQAKEVARLPAEPVISGVEMAQRIEDASAGDLPGIVKSVVDGVMSFLTLDDFFPETREAKAALDEMRMTMRVPLVKALSVRGGKFTIQQVDKILPSSALPDAKNMARIRALIPTYKETLNEAMRIYENQPVGSQYYVAAEKTIYTIMSLLPELQEMVTAWDNRKQLGAVPPEGEIRLPSGVVVKKLSGRSSSGSVSPTVPTDQ